MLTIKFFYRPSAGKQKPEGRIYLRLIHKRRIATLSTSLAVLHHEWDPVREETLLSEAHEKRKPYLEQINRELQKYRRQLEQIRHQLEQEGRLCTDSALSLFKEGNGQKTWNALLPVLQKELLSLGQVRTAEAYGSSQRQLLLFAGKEELPLTATTPELIRQFEGRLKEKGRSLNTISFYMRNLRAMIGKAIRKGWMAAPKENLFSGVFTGVETTRKRALPKEELSRLSRLFSDEKAVIRQSDRDTLGLFLFSFHARGMSFVDLAHLKKEDIHGDRLCYIRRKTGKQMEVEVSSELKKVIRYFSHRTGNSPYLLPVITDAGSDPRKQYLRMLRLQNKRLKRLSSHLRKTLSLSTHMARHSWATLAKREHIPLRVISECLGHSSEKTTQIYLDAFDRSVLDEAGRKVARALCQAV